MPMAKASIGDGYADMTGYVHYYNLNPNYYSPDYNIFYDAGEFMMNHVPQADYEAWKQALNKAVIYKKMTDKGYYEKLNEDIKLLEWYSAIN